MKKALCFLMSFALVISMFVSGCSRSSAMDSQKISQIMQGERDVNTTITHVGSADPMIYGEGKLLFHDEQFEYVCDPDGYIILAARVSGADNQVDTYELKFDSGEDEKTRAVNLHLRNFSSKQTNEYDIKETQTPMGMLMIEIIETKDRLPTGRKTSVSFSKGGALLSLVTYNKPVAEPNPSITGLIADEKAARIAFEDLMERLGDVLTVAAFSDVHWKSEKTTFESRLVWKIEIDQLVRTDFSAAITSWSVLYWIDIYTGEIVERAEAA